MDALREIEPIPRSGADPAIPLALLGVLNEFHRQQVSYCYWKSSRRLHQVLAGEGDLDLLVARAEVHRAQQILLALDFKSFPVVGDRDHPATLNFLGFDEPSGRLLHLHLHSSLIVGERALKNYCIRWETAFLDRALLHSSLPIRILDPSSEAVLLVIRACLELTRLDLITLCLWRATTRKFALDRLDLVGRVERSALCAHAAELLNDDLAELVVDAFYDPKPLEKRTQLRRRIRNYCAPYRGYNALEARLRSFGRSLRWAGAVLNKRVFHAPRPWNRRTPGGGWVVAIVGVDGSGKSTSVSTIRAWLSAKIDILPLYFGTGDGRPSWFLWPLKLMMPMAMRFVRNKPNCSSHGRKSGRPPGLLYSLLLSVWAVAVAADKRNKLAAAWRGANRGLVILTDRYPQNQIPGFNDGPLLTRLKAAPLWLRRFEGDAYVLAERLPPDLVIKLVVTPETAARREPSMDPAVIRERIAGLERLEFRGARVVRVDAQRPLADVIRTIKREIWRLI
ncbi:hypothetical protein KUL72_27650 [Bradyrhizobium arachidis]|uniref:hypothetical protein n=1 Tax=Bradyrhizobium TaxID=374 RepID=UPI0021622259|nr:MULTISPECIES: hypothetical protein [Bradyrhizobium]MDN4988574.1 hypothetical protein [Bradyrhizobium sp. WYCCWR 13022]UVO35201.1 hypothetical protein KUL72_27650 [Bradyrhizobium arachidis]